MLTGFRRTRWPRQRFSESCAVRIFAKISRICEFRVIMGIMTGRLGCCSSSILGSRVNDYVKTLATLGFWLHHSPCPAPSGAGRTTPSQPGHYPLTNGSQATVRTCNDYSGSAKFLLKVRATRYSIVTDCNCEISCWVHYWTSSDWATCVSDFKYTKDVWNESKKNQYSRIGGHIVPVWY